MEGVKMTESYFELNIVRLLGDNKVYNGERIRFHALVEAESEMLRISKNPYEFEQAEIFCFIIREIPFGQLSINGDADCLTERVYLPDGSKMDERLIASGCFVGIFYGRLESQIRFQPGQSVRVLDLTRKQVWDGFVYATPRTVDEVTKLYENDLPPIRLDSSEDSYVILERPLSECKTDEDYMDAHSQVSALRVFGL